MQLHPIEKGNRMFEIKRQDKIRITILERIGRQKKKQDRLPRLIFNGERGGLPIV